MPLKWIVPRSKAFASSVGATPSPKPKAIRQSRRNDRREQLCAIVREEMARDSGPPTDYAFKVLALDQRGDQFLVLVNLSAPLTARQSEIEARIMRAAHARLNMRIQAVYWRTAIPVATPPVKAAQPSPSGHDHDFQDTMMVPQGGRRSLDLSDTNFGEPR